MRVNSVTEQASRERFWDAGPFLLRNVVFVDVDVVSKGVEMPTEHEGSVHEWAWINKLTFFFDFHFLDIEYEASVENLLSQSTFPSENDDLIVSDLVR